MKGPPQQEELSKRATGVKAGGDGSRVRAGGVKERWRGGQHIWMATLSSQQSQHTSSAAPLTFLTRSASVPGCASVCCPLHHRYLSTLPPIAAWTGSFHTHTHVQYVHTHLSCLTGPLAFLRGRRGADKVTGCDVSRGRWPQITLERVSTRTCGAHSRQAVSGDDERNLVICCVCVSSSIWCRLPSTSVCVSVCV